MKLPGKKSFKVSIIEIEFQFKSKASRYAKQEVYVSIHLYVFAPILYLKPQSLIDF